MGVATIEEELQILDTKLSQLKRDYEQYFLGTRPREPVQLRSEVNKVVARLSNTPIQNTACRFRFSSLCSRFQAQRRQWDEILRKIEAGTYERHRFKAKMHGVAEPPSAAKPRKSGEKAGAGKGDLYQSYLDARVACGESVQGVSRDKLEKVIEKQRAQLRSKYGDKTDFAFRVSVEDGKVKLKASRKKT